MSITIEPLTPEQIAFVNRPMTFYDITPATAEIAAKRLQSLLAGKRYIYIHDIDGGSEMQVRTGIELANGSDSVTVEHDDQGVPASLWINQSSHLLFVEFTGVSHRPPHIAFEMPRYGDETVVHITQYDAGTYRNQRVRFVFIVPA